MDDSIKVNTALLYAFGVSPAIGKLFVLMLLEGFERLASGVTIKSYARVSPTEATLFRGRLHGVIRRVFIYQTGYVIPELSLKGILQFSPPLT